MMYMWSQVQRVSSDLIGHPEANGLIEQLSASAQQCPVNAQALLLT